MPPKALKCLCAKICSDSVEVELVVVLCASEEQEVIAQSRCLGLTGTDIYIYKHGATMQPDYLPHFTARQLLVFPVHVCIHPCSRFGPI